MDAQHDGTEHVSTARPDAKSERDLALKHMDGSKANYVFKEKTLRNLRPKFDVPEHRLGHCPVNEAMWRIFMNSCVWAAVHFSKDGDQRQRDLRNMDVDVIENVCTTVRKIRSAV